MKIPTPPGPTRLDSIRGFFKISPARGRVKSLGISLFLCHFFFFFLLGYMVAFHVLIKSLARIHICFIVVPPPHTQIRYSAMLSLLR